MRYINFTSDPPAIAPDEFFMNEALKEARVALSLDEVPIGAVVVCNGRIIGRGHNLTEQLNDVTAHAEMQAFTAAANYLGGKYLKDCTLYVTIEPCIMCAGASYWTQISRIVFGAHDVKRGFMRINQQITHPKTEIVAGIKENECSTIVKEFFQRKRT
ncbi:nucleoside deaminase [Hufsiella ginkgonis]|uniref:tRNA-specific adenosine deaminase n=1 Tax=Hufsiella ginkgonis TaxID=2695274 RepID=A0A7K1XSP3_9SPHI|nr:nucleoside deaminase [Hufsiella ginkgonis]MXV13972.1 nucleoside deaminase [Hufsiella ginkgonis]